MNLLRISQRFPDQQACIRYLEEKRWGQQPCCPHCGSQRVARKQQGKRIGRWNAMVASPVSMCFRHHLRENHGVVAQVVSGRWLDGDCQEKPVRLTVDSWPVMQDSIPGQPGSGSSASVPAWPPMKPPCDQAWWRWMKPVWEVNPTKRIAVRTILLAAGRLAVAPRTRLPLPVRWNGVVTPMARDLSGKGILRFFQEAVGPRQTVLITDACTACRKATQESYHHAVINHSVAYGDGSVHTNRIEGFWSLLKRAWYGCHHH